VLGISGAFVGGFSLFWARSDDVSCCSGIRSSFVLSGMILGVFEAVGVVVEC
jgi:hypothetical protein